MQSVQNSLLLVLLPSLFAAGCPQPKDPADETPPDPRVIVSASGDLEGVVQGHNQFSIDMYEALAAEDGNLFFSPFSVTAALSMTMAGAEGVTETEMLDVLHVETDEAVYHEALGELIRDLAGFHEGRGYTLNIANRLFGEEGYPWKEDFLDVCGFHYDAPVEDVNFSGDSETARLYINEWVADQTEGYIDELFAPGVINADTRLALTNAIYFKADWASQFDEAATTDQTFTRSDGSPVTVPMMYQAASLAMGWDDGLQIAQIPYQDDELSMFVLLPDAVDGLSAIEDALPTELDNWLSSVGSPGEVELFLPRFEMRYDTSLVTVLADLGMPSAFSSGDADLSGIADLVEGPLFIEDVVHDAYVSVDESGTEAAAATGVVVSVESAGPVFYADHPFLFLIRDDLTGSILFMGRVADPTAG
jgi:serpin B